MSKPIRRQPKLQKEPPMQDTVDFDELQVGVGRLFERMGIPSGLPIDTKPPAAEDLLASILKEIIEMKSLLRDIKELAKY